MGKRKKANNNNKKVSFSLSLTMFINYLLINTVCFHSQFINYFYSFHINYLFIAFACFSEVALLFSLLVLYILDFNLLIAICVTHTFLVCHLSFDLFMVFWLYRSLKIFKWSESSTNVSLLAWQRG